MPWDLGLRVRVRVEGLGCGVQGLGISDKVLWIQALGCRV